MCEILRKFGIDGLYICLPYLYIDDDDDDDDDVQWFNVHLKAD